MPTSYGKLNDGSAGYAIIMELDSFFELMADNQAPDARLYFNSNFKDYLSKYTSASEFAD